MRDHPRARDARSRIVEASLYATTQAMSRELGDLAWAAYRLGDDAQRELVDVVFDMARFSVKDMAARASDWTQQACESAALLGRGLDLAWQQGRNNFEVYSLVKNVRSRLRLDWHHEFDLRALVHTAYALGPYPDLWAVEGLGHDYAAMCLDEEQRHEGILREGAAADLPRRSLTMMHAGLGLALAERAVKRLTPYSEAEDFDRTLTAFLGACDANSRPGYAGAAYESLGLVVRTWHPLLVHRVVDGLRRVDETVLGYFWHGAGRALYFLPTYIIPGVLSPWRAADREAPDERAHNNLYAGLAWATTLVNMRQPRIVAHLLRVRGESLACSPGFANGVASAIVMAIDTTPDDPLVLAFEAFDTADLEPAVANLWNAIVRPAVISALEWYHPVIQQHGRLDLIFEYTDLDLVAGRLERGEQLHGIDHHAEAPGSVERGGAVPGIYPSSATEAWRGEQPS